MNFLRNQNHLKPLFYRAAAALAVIAGLVQLISLWAGLPDLQSDWQVLTSLPAVKALPFDGFAVYVLALRWLATVLAWTAAFVLFRLPAAANWTARLAALLMAFLPGLLVINTNSSLGLPSPWRSLVAGLGAAQAPAALLLLMLFTFLFPNGRFAPAWVGLVAAALGGGLLLVFSGILGDDLFLVAVLFLLVALLLGAGSQAYRYLRRAGDAQRRQTGPVAAALALLPVCFALGILLSAPGWPGLISLHLQTLGEVLLPAALLWAVLRRALWRDGAPLPAGPLRAAAPAVFALGFAALAAGYLLPLRPERLAFEPLPAASAPRPVIIDTDMAPDDWIAILYLLQRPDIEVKAITVAGTGEAHCHPGVQNALGLAAVAGKTGIPVACGRETPLQGQNVFPTEWRETADNMAGLSLPVVEQEAFEQDAVTLIARVMDQSPQKVTLLALGPLTNLGDGLQRDPHFLANAEMVYVMGGALRVTGNVGYSGIPNQVAEWNIYIDPAAAQIVFESGTPVTLVPLDATNTAPVDLDFFRLLQANRRTPEAEFVYQTLQSRLPEVASGAYYLWDPMAAALLVDESLGVIREGKVKIYTAPGQSSGMTRINDSGFPMRYAVSFDRRRFEMEFLRALNQP